MFPHPCGRQLEQAVNEGADPATVVPADFFLVHGGTLAVDASFEFSCAVGPTLEAAAAAVPHGQIRFMTVGNMRAVGGIVTWEIEFSRAGTMNPQHVNVAVPTATGFSTLMPNPVSIRRRIDGIRKRGPKP